MNANRKIIVLQHAAPETLGTIEIALQSQGLSPAYVRIFAGDHVPASLEDAAGLIVMGGPMSVYEQDQYPHLRDELRLIESALKAQRPVLGVCLGSQLLAAALGAPVVAGKQKEIGWYSLRLAADAGNDALWSGVTEPLTVFHWHGDVFSLPQGAVHLASSELTPIQVFRYGKSAYGFLCHLEVNEGLIAGMQSAFAGELRQVEISPEQMNRETQSHLPRLRNTAKTIWARWARLAAHES